MAGAWTMTEDGQFVLDPAFDTRLKEIKQNISNKWVDNICEELAKSTDYSKEDLQSDLIYRISKLDVITAKSTEIVDEFIIQALEGDI